MGWVGRRLLLAVRQPHCCTAIVPLGTGPSALWPAPSAPMHAVLKRLLSPRPSLLSLCAVCNQPRLVLGTPLSLLPGKPTVSGAALMLRGSSSLGHALTGHGRSCREAAGVQFLVMLGRGGWPGAPWGCIGWGSEVMG